MNNPLLALSTAARDTVAAVAPLIAAIRIGPNRHVTGLVCQNDLLVTTDQAMPAQDTYTVVLPGQAVSGARVGRRDAGRNLVCLSLASPVGAPMPVVTAPVVTMPVPGAIVLCIGADSDASPTVRMTVVHRLAGGLDSPAAVLDMGADRLDQGSLVCDTDGRLMGLAALSPSGEVMAVPAASIARVVSGIAEPVSRRGWLGVSLQPITVPPPLLARVGQPSGRLVVGITAGGPADRAGLRVGDVLLAVNGTATTGPQALRAFLDADLIGTTVEVKLLRDGALLRRDLTVAVHPA